MRKVGAGRRCVWRDAKHGGRDARAPLSFMAFIGNSLNEHYS